MFRQSLVGSIPAGPLPTRDSVLRPGGTWPSRDLVLIEDMVLLEPAVPRELKPNQLFLGPPGLPRAMLGRPVVLEGKERNWTFQRLTS